MKLARVIYQTTPELVFNAFRLANFSAKPQGGEDARMSFVDIFSFRMSETLAKRQTTGENR